MHSIKPKATTKTTRILANQPAKEVRLLKWNHKKSLIQKKAE